MRHLQLARPFSFLSEIDKDFDNLFYPQKSGLSSWNPQSRIYDEDNHYHVAMDIPGVDREHLKVDLKDNILSIKGERRDLVKSEQQEMQSHGSFEQSFSLPKDANIKEIEVSQINGVLDIVIPKKNPELESQAIEIKSGKNALL